MIDEFQCLNHDNYLLYPLIQGVSSWKGATSAGNTSGAICSVPVRDVVWVQHNMLIKFNEKGFNNFLSLQVQDIL